MRMYQLTASRSVMFAFALVCTTAGNAVAQWFSVPVPGTPRTADGKPNLSAPAPRTADGKADHSGIWKLDTSGHNPNYNLLAKGTEAPMLPWAAELFKRRVATHGFDRPMTVCLPHGVPDGLTSPYGFKLIQTPVLTVHLYRGIHEVPPDSHRRTVAACRSKPPVLTGTPSADGRVRRSLSRAPDSKKAAGSTTTVIRIPKPSGRPSDSAG